jgi:hypothetical protein
MSLYSEFKELQELKLALLTFLDKPHLDSTWNELAEHLPDVFKLANPYALMFACNRCGKGWSPPLDRAYRARARANVCWDCEPEGW